jgi:trafficking protein particle complex subunit 9
MTLSQAHGPFLMHLQQPDQIRIFSTLASLYSCIGFKRKEALVLREVQAAIMDLIVCGRDEHRSNLGRESLSNESKIYLFDRDRDKDRDTGQSVSGALGVRETEDVEGNISIVRLAKCIAEVYGVDIACIRVMDVASEAPTTEGSHPIGPLEPTDMMGRPHFGWPELQIGVVRETVAVAEALPGQWSWIPEVKLFIVTRWDFVDHASVVQFSLSTLKTLHKFLTANEQYHLYSVALRGISTLRRRGVNLRAEFWAEAPIVSIEVLPCVLCLSYMNCGSEPHTKSPPRLPLPRLPSEHLPQDLEGHHSKRPSITLPGGPFLYHPAGKKAAASQECFTLNFCVVSTIHPVLWRSDRCAERVH